MNALVCKNIEQLIFRHKIMNSMLRIFPIFLVSPLRPFNDLDIHLSILFIHVIKCHFTHFFKKLFSPITFFARKK